ncbi:uncharacterized protein YALI1_E02525g [Yarrowia lipolytica]|uniref:Uncharacterized protein n=1 Tax=Yarrowia lipolytica TaxID=4952 RepID=A0A1D8NGS3_YARLL|nr:hypothetical protein YALI1_E02525g [Yarrowia lipolytica]
MTHINRCIFRLGAYCRRIILLRSLHTGVMLFETSLSNLARKTLRDYVAGNLGSSEPGSNHSLIDALLSGNPHLKRTLETAVACGLER